MKRLFRGKWMSLCYLIVACILFVGCSKQTSHIPEKHEIPVPEGYVTSMDEAGADSFQSLLDDTESRYYKINDFYNMKSEGSLHILSHFATYQQTTEYTCGAASALMVLNHFGEKTYDEMKLAEMLHVDPNKGVAPENMEAFFSELGWRVDSHVGTDHRFEQPEEFADYLKKQIDAGNPVLVDWVDWAGHWQVVIGIDTCNELSVYDDVLILADPYDVTDSYQDGYYTFPLGRFFGMWYEGTCVQKTEPLKQPFVTASPK